MATLKHIIFIFFALSVSSCKANDVSPPSMESSSKTFNERQARGLVARMSVETMFPDQKARALAMAAGKGKVADMVKLVSQGADVNSRGAEGATPLFWSLRNSSLGGFRKLLDLGADPNAKFADGSIMHWAARHKDIRFLQAALAHGGDPNLEAGQLNETPLFKTIGVGNSDNMAAMELLINAGANINAVTSGEKILGVSMGGKTPLMTAADVVRYDIVYELLVRGADYRLAADTGRRLKDRILAVEGRFPVGSKQDIALRKCITWLSERGEM